MTSYPAALALAAMTVLSGLTILTRYWPARSHGLPRAPRVRQVLDNASLDELLGPWPEPVYGTPVVWAFRACPTTGADEPHALHEDGSRTCSCCFTTTVAGGVS